jgi:NLI interacting factor-like phosphatase
MARVIFDLDGTIVGNVNGRYVLRRGIVDVIQSRKRKGDTVILWTFGNRPWWRHVRRMFPQLAGLFDEVYTRDEMPGHVTHNAAGPEFVKDIRLIAGDVLVDNDPSHHEWARRHGLAARYIQVATLGT